MARINLTPHRKFRRLARALGSAALARGTLELLWETAYEAADAYVGNAEDVADAVGWRDDARALVALLLDAGFVDELSMDAYRVHDLWDHAPKYVRQRWERAHPNQPRPWVTTSTSVPETGPYPPRPAPPHREEQRLPPRSPCADPVDSNPRVLQRLVYELPPALEDEADKKDALKTLAARYRLTYDATSITTALDTVAQARRRRQRWIRDPWYGKRPAAGRRRRAR